MIPRASSEHHIMINKSLINIKCSQMLINFQFIQYMIMHFITIYKLF